jgi:hypothetical protein
VQEKTPEGAENSMYYVKYRAVAPKLKPLIQEIENRSQIREYSQHTFCAEALPRFRTLPRYQALLSDCHYGYFEQRRILLSAPIAAQIRALTQSKNLHEMVRLPSTLITCAT